MSSVGKQHNINELL